MNEPRMNEPGRSALDGDKTHPASASPSPPPAQTPEPDVGNTLRPLPGEAGIPQVAKRTPLNWSGKGALSLVLMGCTVVLFVGFSIQRCSAADPPTADMSPARDRPLAASSTPRKLDMTPPVAPRVPALLPDKDEVEPVGVQRTGHSAATGDKPASQAPEDAPVMVVSSRPGAPATTAATSTLKNAPRDAAANPDDELATATSSLEHHQRQLQALLDQLTQGTATSATASGATASPANASAATAGQSSALPVTASALFGGQLQGSATPKVAARLLGDRSLTLPKGTAFTCALKTRVISATSGLVGCQVQRDVYGDNGRVLLIERGSHLDGEYRSASVRPGSVRIPVLWTRVRTPHGVTVDIESPGTGQLGESGIDAHVDNRWGERIGAALLLSLIDDSVQLVIQSQAKDQQANTIVLPSTTDNASQLAEKVLDSTINIPPLMVQNQGGIVGIYVTRDVDFSSVYELQPTKR
ncbi:MAG: type IV secretion system protein VirB10 [Hydrogenophaga sp.]|nr:type IV secretion system protein VirB10 [Hydrogenophaga sp.]